MQLLSMNLICLTVLACRSTPAANKKQEHKDPRGRGKGIASNKIASAHKTARDYGKETKKSQEALDQQKEDIYEGNF